MQLFWNNLEFLRIWYIFIDFFIDVFIDAFLLNSQKFLYQKLSLLFNFVLNLFRSNSIYWTSLNNSNWTYLDNIVFIQILIFFFFDFDFLFLILFIFWFFFSRLIYTSKIKTNEKILIFTKINRNINFINY